MSPKGPAVACTNCRDRKVRCVGASTESACRNCMIRDEAQSCLLAESRRGGKRKRQCSSGHALREAIKGSHSNDQSLQSYPGGSSQSHHRYSVEQSLGNLLLLLDVDNVDGSESTALMAYYDTFHQSHPFLPAIEHLLATLVTSDCPQLLYTVFAIGYRVLAVPKLGRADFFADLARLEITKRAEHPDNSKSIHYIQLLVAHSLLEFACGERTLSISLLRNACHLLFNGPLHRVGQDIKPGSVSESSQSLLATIWEIWMCDIMFAALTGCDAGSCAFSAPELTLMVPCCQQSVNSASAVSFSCRWRRSSTKDSRSLSSQLSQRLNLLH